MDHVLNGFLKRQYEEGMALAEASDLLEILPLGEYPPDRYLASLHCRGLVRGTDGRIVEADLFNVGIWFPSDFLMQASTFRSLTWLGPITAFHPNISDRAPFICIGNLVPGTSLVDILTQVHEVVTYAKANMNENDALNHAACEWARRNQERFPIDDRPIRRGGFSFELEAVGR